MPSNLSFKSVGLTLYIFFTLIFGILLQGGEFFWLGFAAASASLLLLYYFNKSYRHSLALPKSTINTAVLLFTAWCFLTVFWSEVPHLSLLKAISISAAPMGIYSFFFLTQSNIKWDYLWSIIIAVGLVLFIYSIIEVYIGIPAPNSLFFNKNTHAAYLNLIILPTTAYFIISKSPRLKTLLGLALFLLIYSHALPGSRGATLGQAIGLGMIFFASRKHISISNIKYLAGIYISAYGLATLTTSNMLRFVAYKIEDADLGRWEIWEGAINLLKDTPWYGSGVGTYWLTHPAYRHIGDPSSGQNPHNDYLQYLIEAGIPGLLLLVSLIVLILVSWWKTIRQEDLGAEKKLEASALIGAITSIGFHAFFTYNLGVFSILFMIGLLIGRFLYISNQTKMYNFLGKLPIRKSIFTFSVSTLAFVLFSFYLTISVYSQLYVRAALAYIDGDIKKADQLNSIALALYPYDDRTYILYAHIYENILEKVVELNDKKRQYYFQITMEYLDKAIQINPHRAKTYLLKGRVIENNSDLAESNLQTTVETLYQKSLKTDPRYFDAVIQLVKFYSKKGQGGITSKIILNFLEYWQPNNEKTLEYYTELEPYIVESQSKEDVTLFMKKKKALLNSLELKGIDISSNDI